MPHVINARPLRRYHENWTPVHRPWKICLVVVFGITIGGNPSWNRWTNGYKAFRVFGVGVYHVLSWIQSGACQFYASSMKRLWVLLVCTFNFVSRMLPEYLTFETCNVKIHNDFPLFLYFVFVSVSHRLVSNEFVYVKWALCILYLWFSKFIHYLVYTSFIDTILTVQLAVKRHDLEKNFRKSCNE